jgi:LytR cell envelope-related transcriptional attenuator
VIGVGLLVLGLITLRGRPADGERPPAAAPTSSGASRSTSSPSAPSTEATTGQPSTPPGSAKRTSTPPRTSAAPHTTPSRPPARAPLTVLNNSKIRGLAQQVAVSVRAKGWQVVLVGNFAGRLPVTTVYYTPGNLAQQRAAEQLAREFPRIARVFPRYAGLPPTPAGIVLVVTRDWVS